MTEPIDDLIRDRMRDSFTLDNTSDVVLESLRPQMVQARSRRKVLQASAGALGAGAVLFGALMISSQFSTNSTELQLAGGVEAGAEFGDGSPKEFSSPSSSDALGRSLADPPDDSSLAPATSDLQDAAVAEPSTTPNSEEPDTTASPDTTAATATAVEGATTEPATTVGPSTTTAPTTATSTTTVDPSTTTASTSAAPTTTDASTSTTINTLCGSLEVRLSGSGIELVSTDPNSGVEVDVKDSGPDEVEVSFEGTESHCEVIAENRNGKVWSDVTEDTE